MASIVAVDNFDSTKFDQNQPKKGGFEFGNKQSNYFFESSSKKVVGLNINLSDYLKRKNSFFSFHGEDRKSVSENDLILSISKSFDNVKNRYKVQTGNYVGKFFHNNIEIDIRSRFNNKFLERMLNFANDIFLDDVSVLGEIDNEKLDISKYIIYYMFIQNLEKAFLLELPKRYMTKRYHELKLKGNIDINQFIKKDVPFIGKISSVTREQKEDQEVIDILYQALKIIKKDLSPSALKNVFHIFTYVKQKKSNTKVTFDTINKAKKSKSLLNPIFAQYKIIIDYASYIINGGSIANNKFGNGKSFGFIINAVELFEIYLSKLLKRKFTDWEIVSPKIEIYTQQFYKRRIIPDIVMMKDDKVIVFDVKYKQMKFGERNQYGPGDLDRNDFFQINTYMNYYQNQGYKILAGGLLYPIETEWSKDICYSNNWFGKSETKFIVDGVEIPKKDKLISEKGLNKLIEKENAFLDRISTLINE